MSNFLIAYSKLVALKKNLPETSDVEAYYAEQYHQLLDSLREEIGDEIDEFKVEQSEIAPTITRVSPFEGTSYSSKSYCSRNKLLAKLDGLLNYITLQSPKADREKIIGFSRDLT